MFTGIVEAIGTVARVDDAAQSRRVRVEAPTLADSLRDGDSVSVDGVCLTVERADADGFDATAVKETLARTTLADRQIGDRVNLERAATLTRYFGGHLVQGHIDATARVAAEFPSFSMDFYVSMRMAPRQLMTFHGDRGWLAVHAPFNAGAYGDAVIELRNQDATVVIERFPRSDHYRAQIDAFNASVLDGVPYACTLEFSRGNQAMIDMIYAAAARDGA